jgi:hypothetical protein
MLKYVRKVWKVRKMHRLLGNERLLIDHEQFSYHTESLVYSRQILSLT